MTDDWLSESEAKEVGARLEALCRELSPRQHEFLKEALSLAGADLWARTNGAPANRAIQELIMDIQQAGAAHAISLNPLPIPQQPKGPIA
jgi:hypothetical protein